MVSDTDGVIILYSSIIPYLLFEELSVIICCINTLQVLPQPYLVLALNHTCGTQSVSLATLTVDQLATSFPQSIGMVT